MFCSYVTEFILTDIYRFDSFMPGMYERIRDILGTLIGYEIPCKDQLPYRAWTQLQRLTKLIDSDIADHANA